jgi:hypothetical protein
MGEKRSAMEFVGIVKAMRAAQDSYWKTTAYSLEKKRLLIKAKELEKRVDDWIADIEGRVEAQKQPGLGM